MDLEKTESMEPIVPTTSPAQQPAASGAGAASEVKEIGRSIAQANDRTLSEHSTPEVQDVPPCSERTEKDPRMLMSDNPHRLELEKNPGFGPTCIYCGVYRRFQNWTEECCAQTSGLACVFEGGER